MVGHLTIDKASMNISYFLYSIKLVANHDGIISRNDFSKEMGEFAEIAYQKDGKENRTPYNKSKLPRYFGFISIKKIEKKTYLVLTNRGKRILDCIEENVGKPNDEKFSIKSEKITSFLDTIIESVVFDSFGKNNCGAENSNTDIEPPKILFKMLVDLEKITAEEFCYVLFGLNSLKLKSYDEAIATILSNRKQGKYSYEKELEKLEVLNIAKDCKLIDLFSDPNFELLTKTKDIQFNKYFYSLSDKITDKSKRQFKKLSYYYKPTRNNFYFEHKTDITSWLNQSILGKEYDNSYVFNLSLTENNIGKINNNIFEPGQIEKGLLLSFSDLKKNIYFVYKYKDESDIAKILGKYSTLFNTINDFKSPLNGWSKKYIIDSVVYNYLCKQNLKIKKILNNGKIRFASNVHFVGVCENYGK